ncbi:MAG TPA: efflux transporter outer membrane subunit [Acidobacteriaceae bacterium]|nr:efflux transporter outer membrane subunit [Acidobacteriaceae bacterium]
MKTRIPAPFVPRPARRRASRRILCVLSSALCALSLAGCMVGPKYHAPVPPRISAQNYKESTVNFRNQPGWKVANPNAPMLQGNWWEIFHEPELNALEDQLNINNQTIKQYFEQYVEARALVAEARAQFWPTLTFSPSWNRQRTSGNLRSSTYANTGATSTVWEAPLDASWTPDLWGKIRREVQSAEYAAQVSAADLAGEKLTEQASLAEYYFEIRGQDELQLIYNQTVKADQAALDATEGAYQAGTGDYISVVEARATLAAAQAAATNVGLARAQYEHAVAVLLGRVATDFSIPVRPMIYNPPPIPTGLPSELLERRPDVAAAERTLAEANATIGIGYGAFFPQVSLSAAGGTQTSNIAHIADWPSRFWSLGASASQIVFDAGLYRAELHQYEAIYNADLASYRGTTLTAFQQVEDDLAATRIYSQQILQQQVAVSAAQQFLTLEMERYKTGVDPYVDVVTAQTGVLSDQQSLNALQVSQMVSAVELIEALGGGWDRAQLPTPSQAGAQPAASVYAIQK